MLEAKAGDILWRWTYECHTCIFNSDREICVLRQKPISGNDGLGGVAPCDLDNLLPEGPISS